MDTFQKRIEHVGKELGGSPGASPESSRTAMAWLPIRHEEIHWIRSTSTIVSLAQLISHTNIAMPSTAKLSVRLHVHLHIAVVVVRRSSHPIHNQHAQSFQAAAQTKALSIVDKAPTVLETLATTTSPTDAATLATLIASTLETVHTTVLPDLHALTDYITLTIPLHEDGGNFGVSVQLGVLKGITDSTEALLKLADDTAGYAAARAEALDKLPKKDESVVTTTTVEEATDEEGTKKSTKKTVVTTTKESSPTLASEWRSTHVVAALDASYTHKLARLQRLAFTTYATAVDLCDKNASKLAQPKTESRGGGYSSMYWEWELRNNNNRTLDIIRSSMQRVK